MSLDVTDVHVLSEELHKQNELRERITETAFDALVAVDERGIVSVYNRAAEELFGAPRSEVLERARGERFLPDAFMRAVAEDGEDILLPETEVVSAGGTPIPVRFSGTVLRSGGRIVGGAAFFQDLRPIKALEREKLQNERLATVGQNILTGLQGGIYDIKTGCARQIEERTAEGVQTLDRNYKRINELVRELLRFSKEHRPELALCDPNSLAREIHALYRKVAARNAIDLRLKLDPEVGPVLLDPAAIHTCLANLMSNAIDACIEAGRGRCTIVLAVEHEQDRLLYRVTDCGSGMSEETRERLFASIFTTKGTLGTGLGLVMTKKIVDDHGGHVRVATELGVGSTFTLELPLTTSAAAPASRRGNHSGEE
jgi:PAS domain S-box-containing protein